MRVLHICQRDDPDIGGSLSVLTALVSEQRAVGVDAWVLFLYGKPGQTMQMFAPKVAALKLKNSKQALSGIRKLKEEIQRISPDIIHSHDGILWPKLAYRAVTIPVVTHAHLPAGNKGLKGKIGWKLTKDTAAAVVGISSHTMQSWIDAGYPSDRIHLVPNGVDFDRFDQPSATEKEQFRKQLGLPSSKKIMLWLGRLHKEMKGTDRVELIANALPPGVVLIVVGNGPEYDGMKARAQKLIENGTLIMAGTSTTPESFYRAADAFLFTSYYEPFGLVILEAVSSGLPILSFPVVRGGGATELLKKFEAMEADDRSSADELQALIHARLFEKNNAAAMREKAQKEYSWASLSLKVNRIYNDVLEGSV